MALLGLCDDLNLSACLLELLNLLSAGKRESSREGIGFGCAGGDHAETFPAVARAASLGVNQMMECAVFGEAASVAATGGESLVFEFGDLVVRICLGLLLQSGFPGAEHFVGDGTCEVAS